jgi:DNA (cytosine-5)-methyltransferase 1
MPTVRLLDLFCGAGGAAMGYHRAGFTEIVGVDIRPQPRYPFTFVQADALTFPLNGFDALHASPPCQAYSCNRHRPNARRDHPALYDAVRVRLLNSGRPFVIENVPGAPSRNAIQLCGTAFQLGADAYDGFRELRRHRWFEVQPFILGQPCRHQRPTIGIYGDHARDRRRRGPNGKGLDFPDADKLRLARAALGIAWMTWPELSQAIPPAYTEYIGKQLLEAR